VLGFDLGAGFFFASKRDPLRWVRVWDTGKIACDELFYFINSSPRAAPLCTPPAGGTFCCAAVGGCGGVKAGAKEGIVWNGHQTAPQPVDQVPAPLHKGRLDPAGCGRDMKSNGGVCSGVNLIESSKKPGTGIARPGF